MAPLSLTPNGSLAPDWEALRASLRGGIAGRLVPLLAVAVLWLAAVVLDADAAPLAPPLLAATAAVAFVPPACAAAARRWCRARGRYAVDALPVIAEVVPNGRRAVDALAAGDVVRLPPGAGAPGSGTVTRVVPWAGGGESATAGAAVQRGESFDDVVDVRLDSVAANPSPVLRPRLPRAGLSRPIAAAAVAGVLAAAAVASAGGSAATAVLCGGLPWAAAAAYRVTAHATAARRCRAGLLDIDAAAAAPRPRYVALDKAGTLTHYNARVAAVHCAPESPVSERALLEVVATVEQGSDHPIAATVLAHARERGVTPSTPPPDVDVQVGLGVRAETAHGEVALGNRALMRECGVDHSSLSGPVADAESRGHSVSFVAVDGTLAGAVAIAYTLRDGVDALASAVRQVGATFALVTGDAERSADAVAAACDFDRVHAPVLGGGEKRAVIEAYEADAGPGTMVGDGPNDADALAAARVGVAFLDAHHAALASADRIACAPALTPLATPLWLAAGRRERAAAVAIVAAVCCFATGVLALGAGTWTGVGAYAAAVPLATAGALAVTRPARERE
jgi:Cu+-exporting ATPase